MNISEFTKRVLPDLPGCPYPMAQEAVVDAIAQFCIQTWILVRGMGVQVTSINAALNDSASLNLSALVDSGFHPVGIKRFMVNGVDYPMERVKMINHVDAVTKVTGFKYYDFPTTSSMLVYPMNTGDVYTEIAVSPAAGATVIDDHLYHYWLDPIVAGAKARLFRMPNKTWTDQQAAALMHLEFSRGLNSARRQLLKAFTKQSGSVNPRSDEIWL